LVHVGTTYKRALKISGLVGPRSFHGIERAEGAR
jgi:hypothetical protein